MEGLAATLRDAGWELRSVVRVPKAAAVVRSALAWFWQVQDYLVLTFALISIDQMDEAALARSGCDVAGQLACWRPCRVTQSVTQSDK